MFNRKSNKKEKGFTLAETLVVVAITAITILATMQIVADMIRIQNRTLAQETMFDQISYFFDYLSKDVRMADTDKNGTCTDVFLEFLGGPSQLPKQMIYQASTKDIFFFSQRGECIYYSLVENNGLGTIVLNKIKKPSATDPMGDQFVLPLTSSDFNVKSLTFSIAGHVDAGDEKLPIVTVVLDIQNKRFEDVKVKIQTTVSQRNLDIF